MIARARKLAQRHKPLIRNVFYVFFLNGAQRLFSLLTIYVLVRVLEINEFGEYQFILSVVAALSIFSLPGLNNAVLQSVARGFDGTFKASLKPTLLFSLIGSAALLVLAFWYASVKQSELFIAVLLAVLLFPFLHGLKGWRFVEVGQENFSFLAWVDSLLSLITTASVIAVALLFPGQALWPLIAVLLVPALQNLYLTVRTLRKRVRNTEIEKASVTYGIRTTLFSGMNLLANHLDKFLIYGLFSPTSLAIFFAAERMADFMRGIAQNLAAVLAPRFAKTETYTLQLDRILNWLSVSLGIAIIIFAFTLLPWIMILLFGEPYRDAIPYAQALLCTVALGNHASFRNRFVQSKLDGRSYRDIVTIISLVRIVASVIFVPLFGITGAIISAFVYRISTVLVLHYIIKNRYQISD